MSDDIHVTEAAVLALQNALPSEEVAQSTPE
jgi:hypothetical protein